MLFMLLMAVLLIMCLVRFAGFSGNSYISLVKVRTGHFSDALSI